MPKVTIEQAHSLDHAEVRRRLTDLERRLASKYGLDINWVSDTECEIKRTGATGSIRCNPSRVVVQLDLSFALTPVKAKVESRIRDELAQALASGTDKNA